MKLYYQNDFGFISNTSLENELARETYLEHKEMNGCFVISFSTEDSYYNDYDERHPIHDVKFKNEYFYTSWEKLTEELIQHSRKSIEDIEKHIVELRTFDGNKYSWNKK